MNINFKAQVLPHLIAVGIFYVLTILFFSPVIFEGKNLSQHDIIQHQGASKESLDYRKETGQEALWTNSMFGGMPTYLLGAEFSGDLIKYVYKYSAFGLPHPIRIVFYSFICFYVLLLCFKVSPTLSIVGSVGWGLNTFNLIGLMAGHNSKIAAVAFIPLVIAGIHLVFTNKKLLGFALTAFATALELRVNHLQITYYLLIIIGIYGVVQLIHHILEKRHKEFSTTVLVLFAAALLGFMANFGRIWTTYEYGQYSTRGKSELTGKDQRSTGLDKDYAFDYSNGITEPLVLFIPNFLGGASNQTLSPDSEVAKVLRSNGYNRQQVKQQIQSVPTYWGKQRLSAPYYAGAIMIFCMIVGMFMVEKKYKYWLLAIIILSVMLSWGKNFAAFNYLLFDYLPGYNKFRSVTFTIIIAIFGINLLGTLGINELFKNGFSKSDQKILLRSTAIAGGLALFFVLFAGMFSFNGLVDAQLPDWFVNALKRDRESLLRSDAIRAVILIALFSGLIFGIIKEKISKQIGIAIMILIVTGDMWTVGKRYLKDSIYQKNVQSRFSKTAADERILQDKDHFYRVLNLNNPFNESETSYYHSSIGGYHGAKIGRYQELIENGLQNEMQQLISDLRSGKDGFSNTNLLNMLNTKYVKFGSEANNVLQNSQAFGNAWFVKKIRQVNSADDELAETINMASDSVAVVDVSKFDLKSATTGAGSVDLINYSPNQMVYRATSSQGGLVVFSDIYYPQGWKATIDNNETTIIRANYVLRAVEVPAGEHNITFTFEPKSYHAGNLIMLIGSILVLLVFVFAIVNEVRTGQSKG